MIHDEDFIQNLKHMAIFLDKDSDKKACNYIEYTINVENVIVFYTIFAGIFRPKYLTKFTTNYIERCFTMVVETNKFLELDSSLVKKILHSSELHITSELQVFNAAEAWINYNIKERIRFAKYLLLAVRLPLLSDAALNYLLNKKSSICEIHKCRSIVQSVLLHNKNSIYNQSSNSFTSRYCNQNMFNIFISEMPKDSKNLKQIDCKDFNSIKTYARSELDEKPYLALYLKGNVYIFVENNDEITIKKYVKTYFSSHWDYVMGLNYRVNFCACVLMNNIFVIGGRNFRNDLFDSCFQCDPKEHICVEAGRTGEVKMLSACTVFEGKIVISGGAVQTFFRVFEPTNTVEVYDHIADTWSYMPKMVRPRYDHSLVAIKNKLFVIGNISAACEVFEKLNNKFVSIKPFSMYFNLNDFSTVGAISIGNRIAVYGRGLSTIAFYDTDKDEWCEEECDYLKNIWKRWSKGFC